MLRKTNSTLHLHTHNISSNEIDNVVVRAARADHRPDALTERGKDYIRLVTDPYHDYNVRSTGVPTLNAGSTYLRNVRLRSSLVVPPLVEGVAAWELHVMVTPVYCQQGAAVLYTKFGGLGTLVSPYIVTNETATIGTPISQMSHICYAWVPIGSALGLLDAKTIFQALPIGSPTWGNYRIVSSGFEVHNSTPELYRSGTVTTWRANNTMELTNLRITAGANKFALARTYTGIPANLALANQFPTSRTWDAAAGCYVVATPDFNDLAFKSYDEGCVVIRTGAVTNVGGVGRGSLIVGGLLDADGDVYSAVVYRSGIVPCGAIFSSIAPESTFTLDCRVVVEVSPDLTSNDLSIASQPTAADPVAIELAALAMAQLPSGVPASFNAAGDWFRMVLKAIGTVAPLVAGLVPHPAAKAALSVAGVASNAATQALDARQRVLASKSPALRTTSAPPDNRLKPRPVPGAAPRRPAPYRRKPK